MLHLGRCLRIRHDGSLPDRGPSPDRSPEVRAGSRAVKFLIGTEILELRILAVDVHARSFTRPFFCRSIEPMDAVQTPARTPAPPPRRVPPSHARLSCLVLPRRTTPSP